MRKRLLVLSLFGALMLSSCGNSPVDPSTSTSSTSKTSGTSETPGKTRAERVQEAVCDLPTIFLRTANTYIESDTTTSIIVKDFTGTYDDVGFSNVTATAKVALSKAEQDKPLNAIVALDAQKGSLDIKTNDEKHPYIDIGLDGQKYSIYFKDGYSHYDLSNDYLLAGLNLAIQKIYGLDEETASGIIDTLLGEKHKVKFANEIEKVDPSAIQEAADIWDAKLRSFDYSILNSNAYDFLDYALRFATRDDGRVEFSITLNKARFFAIRLLTAQSDEDIIAITEEFAKIDTCDFSISFATDAKKCITSFAVDFNYKEKNQSSQSGYFAFSLEKDVFGLNYPDDLEDYKLID